MMFSLFRNGNLCSMRPDEARFLRSSFSAPERALKIQLKSALSSPDEIIFIALDPTDDRLDRQQKRFEKKEIVIAFTKR